jgi:hypothetical protein
MKFLRRKMQGTETVREEGRVIHREIEVTVEREWLSVPFDEHGEGGKQDVTGAEQREIPALELPRLTTLE